MTDNRNNKDVLRTGEKSLSPIEARLLAIDSYVGAVDELFMRRRQQQLGVEQLAAQAVQVETKMDHEEYLEHPTEETNITSVSDISPAGRSAVMDSTVDLNGLREVA
jgi:hypothetical protein